MDIPPSHSPIRHAYERRTWAILSAIYGLLLIYLSLFPFDWNWHPSKERAAFLLPWPDHLSRADVLVNLVAYLPFGLLLALHWRGRFKTWGVVVSATLLGTALSITMEHLQAYVPERDPSLSDALFNGVGTFFGAFTGSIIAVPTALNERLYKWRYNWFQTGPVANLGLAVLGIWALAQLIPLVPSPDIGTLKQGIRPIINVIQDPSRFQWSQTLLYSLDLAGLGVMTLSLIKASQYAVRLYGTFIAAVLLLKISMVTRQLSLEACIGAIAAVLFLSVMRPLYKRNWRLIAVFLLLSAYCVDELRPSDDPNAVFTAFNWLPFSLQLGAPLTGIIDVAETIWPFTALAYISLSMPWQHPRRTMWLGAISILIYVSSLEGWQTNIPGRFGDITTVMLAVTAWWMPWWLYGNSAGEQITFQTRKSRRRPVGDEVKTKRRSRSTF